MGRLDRFFDWFERLDSHRKEEFVAASLILLLLAIICVREYFGQPGVDIVNTYLSIVLTAALVSLYYRQASIQADQTEIMQFNREVREAELSPDLTCRINSADSGELRGELVNRGKGPAAEIFAVVRDSRRDIESKIELIGDDGYRLAILKPGDRENIHFTPKFPFENQQGSVEDLPLSQFQERATLDQNETVQLRLEYEPILGDGRESIFWREVRFDGDLESVFNLQD